MQHLSTIVFLFNKEDDGKVPRHLVIFLVIQHQGCFHPLLVSEAATAASKLTRITWYYFQLKNIPDKALLWQSSSYGVKEKAKCIHTNSFMLP